MTHPFIRDPDVPHDGRGRAYCRCGLPGSPGDSRHREDADRTATVREIEARRLGESEEDE